MAQRSENGYNARTPGRETTEITQDSQTMRQCCFEMVYVWESENEQGEGQMLGDWTRVTLSAARHKTEKI